MQHSFTKRLLLAISLITTTTYATDINLALDKVATQSSSYRNYTPASKAVDGNTDGIWNNGSTASTDKEQGAWWQVDLGDTKTINRIVIYNRTDCCSNRLSNYQVSVSATSDFTTPTYQQTFSTHPDPSNTIDLGGIQGRYVKIQLLGNNYLSLAEVLVLGSRILRDDNIGSRIPRDDNIGNGIPRDNNKGDKGDKGDQGADGQDGADGDAFFTQIGNEVSLQGQNDLTVTGGNFITTGYVQVGDSSAVCDNSNTGAIRYNTSSNLLEFCNATIWQAIASSMPERLSATGKLNDTGITWGGDYPSGNNNTCTGETVSAQDCSHGRDAATLTKVGAGSAGFDFTKLDSNGEALPASASTWSCVQDNHTGLIWEAKTNDGDLHDQSDTYTWYNTDASTNGGGVGTENDSNACYGYDSSNPATYCNTQAFVARVNNAGLCGINNWKLPDVEQLRSIVDYSRTNPAIDTDYFANTPANYFWSSSPLSYSSYYAWNIYFSNGYDNYNYRYNFYRVRLVRDGQ